MQAIQQYLTRFLKFFFLIASVTLTMSFLVLLGSRNKTVGSFFDGFEMRLITPILAAAIFPLFNPIRTKNLFIVGDKKIFLEDLNKAFEKNFMIKILETDAALSFRMKSGINKFTRAYEDQIDIVINAEEIQMTGLLREMNRIQASFLQLQKQRM